MPAAETVCALTGSVLQAAASHACCQLHSATNRNDDTQWAMAFKLAFTTTAQDQAGCRAPEWLWQSSN